MTNHRLILASTSPYRAALLERLGLAFTTAAPRCDEDAHKQRIDEPEELAQRLAWEKAASVAREQPEAFVIGADQLVELDGEVLGKPHSEAGALEQLLRMRGRSHRLLTAICLIAPGGATRAHLDVHTLTLRPLDRASLLRYVRADAPLDCAGSYKIEAQGVRLFSRIDGDDFTAITGLPLIKLTDWLLEAGFAF